MNDTISLEEALSLALKLHPGERLKLIERVAASIEDELALPAEALPEIHWGQNLIRLLNEMPPIEMAHPEDE
jgi:hypothetical protein